MKIKPRSSVIKVGLPLVFAFVAFSCSPEGWKLDYGTPRAHLTEKELAQKGEEYLGEKIVLRGEVAAVTELNEEEVVVTLTDGTRCYFRLLAMARSCEIGSEIHLAGLLKQDGDQLILKPAQVIEAP